MVVEQAAQVVGLVQPIQVAVVVALDTLEMEVTVLFVVLPDVLALAVAVVVVRLLVVAAA